MAVLSLSSRRERREANRFTWAPITEVAVLFAGIFVTMVPAAFLEVHGRQLGLTQPWQFFWVTGLLSSALDNAPTYLPSPRWRRVPTTSMSWSPIRLAD